MGIAHILYAVGDNLARRQTVEHTVMPHGDAVIYSDGVKLFGDTTGGFNFPRDHLAEVF